MKKYFLRFQVAESTTKASAKVLLFYDIRKKNRYFLILYTELLSL